jgi:hypothetical protein
MQIEASGTTTILSRRAVRVLELRSLAEYCEAGNQIPAEIQTELDGMSELRMLIEQAKGEDAYSLLRAVLLSGLTSASLKFPDGEVIITMLPH